MRNLGVTPARHARNLGRDMVVARQLSLIVVTDFLCWFPICVMGLMVQNDVTIPSSAYAWSAVVILPLNSPINPLLYTLKNALIELLKSKKVSQ